MSPVPDLTDTYDEFATPNLSGRYGASVRAVAVHDRSFRRLRVVTRAVAPPRMIDRRRQWVNRPQVGFRTQFNDDRRLIRLKLLMLAAIGLVAALLEMPF